MGVDAVAAAVLPPLSFGHFPRERGKPCWASGISPAGGATLIASIRLSCERGKPSYQLPR